MLCAGRLERGQRNNDDNQEQANKAHITSPTIKFNGVSLSEPNRILTKMVAATRIYQNAIVTLPLKSGEENT